MDLDPDLRKRWLNHLAAGQYNGLNHPTREQKERARAAFNALYAFDPDFRKAIDENRQRREEHRWSARFRRLLKAALWP